MFNKFNKENTHRTQIFKTCKTFNKFNKYSTHQRSGSPEPQDSIIVKPMPKPSRKVVPTPTGGNPQKRKRDTVTEETEQLENTPPAKRAQTDQHSITKPSGKVGQKITPGNAQKRKHDTVTKETGQIKDTPPAKRAQTEKHSIPTPVETPFSITERQASSSPLKTPSRAKDMTWPSPQAHQFSTPGLPRSGITLDQGISSPSQKPEKALPPKRPHSLRKHGEALLFTLERVNEEYRDQLVQLVIARPQIKIGLSDGAGRPADTYHISCWDKMINTEELLPKKLFPKMVETQTGDFHKVGLMARQWLKHSGKVDPKKMVQRLHIIVATWKPGVDVAELWRLDRSQFLGHVSKETCSLSDIIKARDTYVGSDGRLLW
ncbi:hypothetical protein FPRO04_07633 [Fusarium proliferatum]|nr:hypothetical protein FPRO03_10939 [Fusarium proliferatum]KAG4277336.1 hypothetical protein FPRO04_07633 [Fusarium proliferatum]